MKNSVVKDQINLKQTTLWRVAEAERKLFIWIASHTTSFCERNKLFICLRCLWLDILKPSRTLLQQNIKKGYFLKPTIDMELFRFIMQDSMLSHSARSDDIKKSRNTKQNCMEKIVFLYSSIPRKDVSQKKVNCITNFLFSLLFSYRMDWLVLVPQPCSVMMDNNIMMCMYDWWMMMAVILIHFYPLLIVHNCTTRYREP